MLRGVTSRSRRVAGLNPCDCDHEISLVDHDAARTPTEPQTPEPVDMTRNSTRQQLLSPDGSESRRAPSPTPSLGQDDERTEVGGGGTSGSQSRSQSRSQADGISRSQLSRPAIEVQEPTPSVSNGNHYNSNNHTHPKPKTPEREAAIDILYENERGGFLCGIALFSSQALGGLDPTAWTNAYHKTSPTNLHTAQVPDPSWEWSWPEWRINHQEGVDADGWEYSFAFQKTFSWHGARWWNSFVRRRAWTRKRVKKRTEDISSDPHMLNTNYFTVQPASERKYRSMGSIASSRVPSRTSMSQLSSVEVEEKMPDIENIETLVHFLRAARIDREKLEAVESYLEHGADLSQLQDEMHEIMSLFVFQASRRTLLTRLMQVYDETATQLDKNKTSHVNDRQQALKGAIKHADEEVRRLAYWSDVKQMAEGGDIKDAVDTEKGWREDWQGIDQSGGAQPNNGKLPGETPGNVKIHGVKS